MTNAKPPVEAASDPSYKRYHLVCKTKFVTKNVRDEVRPGQFNQYQRVMVLLIPQEGDQRTRFLTAWMPQTREEYFELAGQLGHPVSSPVRLSSHMGHDQWCEKPYLTVMSKGIEEILLKCPEGIRIKLTTLPANADQEADDATDSGGNYNVIS